MTGLVLEGGAMRGLFTAGVLDVLMEQGICLDGTIGVSAGAVFGCNYKSGQIGRTLRYNTRYCRDWRYASFRSLVLTGDLFGERFCYHDIPETLDPFDREAYRNNPMPFWCVCTDAETGEPVYHRCDDGGKEDLQWFRASASMPLVSRVVEVGGRKLLDGGAADSIPLRAMEGLGYHRNVVILTQPEGFVKQPNTLVPLMRRVMKQYPRLVDAMARRHEVYNETLTYVGQQEKAGQCLVIRPPCSLDVKQVEKDPEKLRTAYQLGRAEAEKHLHDIRAFIKEENE